jgi:hypothetical protein
MLLLFFVLLRALRAFVVKGRTISTDAPEGSSTD